ncbi:MAG: type II toxin-antitoxin system VapC family toxin [Patescibacteria group bacterium]
MANDLRVSIDTNSYDKFIEGKATKLKEMVVGGCEILMPFIVVAELRAGFQKGNRMTKNYAKLDAFLASERVTVLFPNHETLEIYARLWAELALKGTPIPTNDLWIATLSLQYTCTLATNDRHFNHVPLLQTVAPNQA